MKLVSVMLHFEWTIEEEVELTTITQYKSLLLMVDGLVQFKTISLSTVIRSRAKGT